MSDWEAAAPARRHVGRLSHCTDTVPRQTREIAAELLANVNEPDQVCSFAQLARRLLSE